MKRHQVTLGALLAVCLLPAAAPERWALVTRTDQVAIYVDTRSIALKDGVLHAWEKWEYAADRPGNYATGHRAYRSAHFLTHFDCRERASAEMQSIFYDAAGEVVGKVTEDPKTTRLTYVVPGLLSEATLNFVCKAKTKKKP
jgi:YD repeat-containing protein